MESSGGHHASLGSSRMRTEMRACSQQIRLCTIPCELYNVTAINATTGTAAARNLYIAESAKVDSSQGIDPRFAVMSSPTPPSVFFFFFFYCTMLGL